MLIIVLGVFMAGLRFKIGGRSGFGVHTDLFEVVKAPND